MFLYYFFQIEIEKYYWGKDSWNSVSRIFFFIYFRDPGQTHKEDFETGTAAALAGGITLIGAMPNTEPAIHDAQTLLLAEEKAKKAHCDYALYLGATPYNAQDIVPLSTQAAALKMYLNPTFRKGNLVFTYCIYLQ